MRAMALGQPAGRCHPQRRGWRSRWCCEPAFNALTAIVLDTAGELHFVANRNTLLRVVPGP
jgi:hypothetical protein